MIISFILSLLSIVLIISSITYYFFIRKELKQDKKIEKEGLLNKFKVYNYLLILTFIICLFSVFYRIFSEMGTLNKNTNIDPNKYQTVINEYKNNVDVRSSLNYFPNYVNKDNVINLSEYHMYGLFDGSYLLYLEYKYNKEEYALEYNKLKNLSIGIESNKLIISDDGYHTKEYVLIDDNNYTITYIFSQFLTLDEIK